MTDGTLSEDHNLRISMENVRLRDDHGNHNKDQMDDIDVSQNLKPGPRSNNSDVLPQDKSRQFLEPEVLAHHNRDAEVDRLLDGKRNRKMKEKGRQSQLAVLEKRRAKLVARTTRIFNEIDNLKYSYQNSVTVKKELAQVNNMFRMLVETHKEQEEIDEEYDDEIWFDNMDQKVFSFKHKVHNWLKEGEKLRKSDQVSRCSLNSSSKHSSKSIAKSSSSSKSSSSEKAKAIEEKVKISELMMEASFIKERRDAEYQTWSLMMEEELAKAQARAEIYENESKISQSRKTKPLTPNDHTSQGISTAEDLDETEKNEVQNEKWKRMFKTQQKSTAILFGSYI